MSESIEVAPGISKRIIKAGEGGELPKTGEQITVNYEGRLENGTIFDSSYEREPFECQIGVGQVIKGWDVGMMTMSIGEEAELTINGDNAYGPQGSPPTIPPNATLIFKVELMKIGDREPKGMSDEELMAAAMVKKEEGNKNFKAGDLKAAASFWKEGVSLLGAFKEPKNEQKQLMVVFGQNIAIASNKLGDYGSAIQAASHALKVDDKAEKALIQRSNAYLKTQQFDEAAADCKAAVMINPKSAAYREQYELIRKEKSAAAKNQQQAMAKFFSQGVYNEKTVTITKKTEFDSLPAFKDSNPQVYFDLSIGEADSDDYVKERVVFELFADVPKTCENFRALCTGENDEVPSYKGNKFHRIIKGFMMQGGDTTAGNGTGGKSIYGEKFEDEGIWYPHTHKGVLSMANAGPNTNGSQFFVCFGATPHLDKKHTIYGRVIHNYTFCETIEQNPCATGDKPIKPVTVVDCGELLDGDKMKAADCDFLSSYSQ